MWYSVPDPGASAAPGCAAAAAKQFVRLGEDARTDDEIPEFERLVGRAGWQRLAGDIRSRFSEKPKPGRPIRYVGIMQAVQCSWAGLLLAQLCRLIGTPFAPYRGSDVPVRISLCHGMQADAVIWDREYCYAQRAPVLVRSTKVGTPQGAVISPLLANIYLHPLDRLMEESGYRMVRYADDFVILCRTAQEAEAALRRATAWVADNGLRLHPDKTRIGDCREPGQGFDFLGYRFEAGRRLVRQKSLRAFKDKVRAMTGRSRGASMRRIIDDLNPMLRGWFGYFKQAAPSIHRHRDGFIRRRLRANLRKQEKRPGFGRCPNDHQRWPNTFFADLGLTLSTARYHARHPQ